MNNISIINACSDLGIHIDGARLGPEILTKNINNEEINIYTLNAKKIEKEIDINNKKKNLDSINDFNSRLYKLIGEVLDNRAFPLVLGRGPFYCYRVSFSFYKKT